MNYDPTNPLIVQGDRTVLVEVDNPRYAEARDALAPFAELEKSPEHIHTYRLSPLSLWNAAAGGLQAQAIIDAYAQGKQDRAEVDDAIVKAQRVISVATNTLSTKILEEQRPVVNELVQKAQMLALPAPDQNSNQ